MIVGILRLVAHRNATRYEMQPDRNNSFSKSHRTFRKLLLFYGSGVRGALMTPSKIWIFAAAAAALTIGHVDYNPKLTGEGFPYPPTNIRDESQFPE